MLTSFAMRSDFSVRIILSRNAHSAGPEWGQLDIQASIRSCCVCRSMTGQLRVQFTLVCYPFDLFDLGALLPRLVVGNGTLEH